MAPKPLGPWSLPDKDTPESARETPTVEEIAAYIESATRVAQLDYIESIARSIGHSADGIMMRAIDVRRREVDR